MSKVPHDSVRWSPGMFAQVRTLIVQTLIALCFAVLEDESNSKVCVCMLFRNLLSNVKKKGM